MIADILRIPGKEWYVQHCSEHGWGCETGDGPLWFHEKGNFVPLLPLLEMPWLSAGELVHQAAQTREGLTPFPFEATLLAALAWSTEHWPTMAVQWLEQGFPLSPAAVISLRAISSNNAMSQRLRHRSLVLIRRGVRREA